MTNIFTTALQALQKQKPFALIRLGDGEGRVLMWPTRICREKIDRHLEFWFGRSDFADNQLNDLREQLIGAVQDVDAVGYYDGDGRNKYWRYPKLFIEQRDLNAGKIVSCNDVHRLLWQSGAIDMLIESAKSVTLVTCRDIVTGFIDRFQKLPQWVAVPEEAKTGKMPTDHFAKFNHYREYIKTLVSPGDLWLVGAGVLGKVYCADIKRTGGVAIDIGSVFDGWAGVKSRSYLGGNGFSLRNTEMS